MSPEMSPETPESPEPQNPAMRTRMKGAIVKVLQKARPQGGVRRKAKDSMIRFRPEGGYVSLAQTGLRKMLRTDSWQVETDPRLDVAEPATAGADPVRLVALAVIELGPASYRAAVMGKPVTVKVPDEATAEVFRAALQVTTQERPTDHLISVEVRASH